MNARAVIVAGGRGTRLRTVSGDALPKALVPVDGVPLIFRQLEWLAREGVHEVALVAGHLAEVLVPAVRGRAAELGLRLHVEVEPAPRGTAGHFQVLRGFAGGSDLLVIYGDMLLDLAVAPLLGAHRARSSVATVVARPNDHPWRSDLLRIDDDGRVREVVPRARKEPSRHYRNLVPASVFCVSPRVFDHLDTGGSLDFTHDVLPRLLAAGEPVHAYLTAEYLRDMGTLEGLAAVERELREGAPRRRRRDARRPAVFFDRDGTLNRALPGHGVLRPEELELLPGAADAVRAVNQAGWLAVLVSNQPQRAKGMVSEEGLEQILGKLETELAEQGAWLDRVYCCPHHPERGHRGEVAELKTDCDCRKPRPGLLLRASRELPIDLDTSLMVGDTWRDAEAARGAGVRSLLVGAEGAQRAQIEAAMLAGAWRGASRSP